ncbi:MAG: hypothetical protein AAGA90_13710 [Actinomycetota bacterium]
MEEGTTGLRQRLRRAPVVVFVVTLAIFGTSPVVSNGDSYLAVPTSMSVLNDLDLDLDEYLGPGTDGGNGYLQRPDGSGEQIPGVQMPRDLSTTEWEHAFDHFPWTTAVLALPVVIALEVGGAIGFDTLDVDRMIAEADTGLPNLIGGSLLAALTAAVITIIALRLLRHDGDRRRRAIGFGIAVALATPLWSTLSRALWSQSSATLFIALAALLAVTLTQDDATRNRTATLLGVAAALAYTARPTAAVVVVGLGVWLLARHRDLVARYIAGGVAVAVPWIAINLATYQSIQPPNFASDRAGWRGETIEAIAANLISPNRGLFVFSSVAVIAVVGALGAVRGRTSIDRPLAVTAVGIVIAHLLVVSAAGESWWGGNSFGPRFMADTIPWLALLAVPAVDALVVNPGWLRRGATLLLVLSIGANGIGAWSKPAACWNVDPVLIDLDPSRVWAWDDLQVLRPFEVLDETGSLREASLGRCNDLLPGRLDQ